MRFAAWSFSLRPRIQASTCSVTTAVCWYDVTGSSTSGTIVEQSARGCHDLIAMKACPPSLCIAPTKKSVWPPKPEWIRALIRDDKIHQIYSTMQSGKKFGMQTMNDALYALYMSRDVALDDCLRASHDPNEFLRMIGQSPEDDGVKKPGGMAGSATARR